MNVMKWTKAASPPGEATVDCQETPVCCRISLLWSTYAQASFFLSHPLDEKAHFDLEIPNAKYKKSTSGLYRDGHKIRITCDPKNWDATAVCSKGVWSTVPFCTSKWVTLNSNECFLSADFAGLLLSCLYEIWCWHPLQNENTGMLPKNRENAFIVFWAVGCIQMILILSQGCTLKWCGLSPDQVQHPLLWAFLLCVDACVPPRRESQFMRCAPSKPSCRHHCSGVPGAVCWGFRSAVSVWRWIHHNWSAKQILNFLQSWKLDRRPNVQ